MMGLPCFGAPVWFRNSLGNDFTTVLARFVHVVLAGYKILHVPHA